MKKSVSLFLAPLILLFAACASSANSRGNLIEPEFIVHQIGGTAFAARHITGPISVNLQVDVINHSDEALQLDQMRMETIGDVGAYVIAAQNRPFGKTIGPGQQRTFELWLPAQAEDTITGNNGPVTVRGIAYFSSSIGKFQKIFITQLNDGMNGQRAPQ
ncbi:MAG: hypothetical protein ABI718_16340 [Acidobacteriota bacterium]